MIEIVSSYVNDAINYLNENYPRKPRVLVHIIEDCDTVQTKTGIGFGVYVPESREIYLAGDIPDRDENLVHNLSHEYMHFLQHCDGKPFDEEEAERFAEEVTQKIMKS